MSASKLTCPKCRRSLMVNPPLPPQIKCSGCGARINLKKPAPASPANNPAIASPHIMAKQPAVTNAGSANLIAKAPAAVPVAGAAGIAPQPNVAFADAKRKSSLLPFILLGLGGGAVLLAGLCVGLLLLFFGGGGSAPSGGAGIDLSVDEIPTKREAKVVPIPPEIRKAIDKGVAYLRKRLKDPGRLYGRGDHEVGAAALAGLTLVECGVSPKDEAVQKTIDAVHASAKQGLNNTYSMSLAVLFMDRLLQHKDVTSAQKTQHKDVLKKLALQLVAGQGQTGGWDYACPPMSNDKEESLLQAMRDRRFEPGKHPFPRRRTRHDNSIAQFGVLALWVSRKYELPIGKSLVKESGRYRAQQDQNSGAWTYVGRATRGGTPQMTCSGLIGLAVGRAILDELPKEEQPKDLDQKGPLMREAHIQKAFGFIGQYLDKLGHEGVEVRRRLQELQQEEQKARARGDQLAAGELNKQRTELTADARDKGIRTTRSPRPNLYFLWSVERVGVIYGVNKMAGRDWYDDGSKVIVEHQQPDGRWTDYNNVVGTCFALLFLNRSNLVKDLSDKLRDLQAQLSAPPGGPPNAPLPPRKDA